MTIHQFMSLRRLGLIGPELSDEIGAAALPAVVLPAKWAEDPDYRFYELVAQRRGWGWPPTID
jgi:hypothetical protein